MIEAAEAGCSREVRADVAAARDRDPAAQGVSTFEILTSWAGVQALLAHRVAHALHEAGVPLAPRAIAYLSRAITGVEIHPAAQIGDEFFIDHGSGVVIGETAEIGDRVTLYQGVTLGGTGFQRGKRHPTARRQRHGRLRAPSCSARSRSATAPRSAPTRSSSRTCRRARPWSATPATRSGSRAGGSRAPTPTGSTCPTRSPRRSRRSRSGSPSSSSGSPSSTATAGARRSERRAAAPHRALLGRRLSLAAAPPLFSAGDAPDRARDPE